MLSPGIAPTALQAQPSCRDPRGLAPGTSEEASAPPGAPGRSLAAVSGLLLQGGPRAELQVEVCDTPSSLPCQVHSVSILGFRASPC